MEGVNLNLINPYQSSYLISLILAPPLPMTEPMMSLGMVISVVRVGTATPAAAAALLAAAAALAACPREAAEFASEARVAEKD